MLEDNFTWVIRKALKGLALSPSEAALRARIPEMDMLAFSRGTFSKDVARAIAPVLGLDPEALANHPDYQPQPIELASVQRIKLPFGGEHVNAWLVSKGEIHLLFDTGDDPHSCREWLRNLGIGTLAAIFITHGHHDHIAGLSALDGPAYGQKVPGAESIVPGDLLQFADLTVRAVDLSGHANPSLGYLIGGLEAPVLVPGDAIFAGSIGGCQSPASYQHALARIRKVLAPLSDETIILPGHGPETTLGEERLRNPFIV